MNMMRWGSNMMRQMSPAGLMLLGAGVALSLPPVRKAMRATAVLAIRGALAIQDSIQDTMSNMRESVSDMMNEARDYDNADSSRSTFLEDARKHGRSAAVTMAGGALAIGDEWKSIVSEAKEARQNRTVKWDGLDPDVADIGPDAREREDKIEEH